MNFKKKKFNNFQILFGIITIVFLAIVSFIIKAQAVNPPGPECIVPPDSGLAYFRIDSGTDVKINRWGVCKRVICASANSYFVPTKTAGEWASFYGHPPAGVTLSECCSQAEEAF